MSTLQRQMDMVAFFEAEAQAGGAEFDQNRGFNHKIANRSIYSAQAPLQAQTCISLFGTEKLKQQACIEILKAGSNLESALIMVVKMTQV
jgi:hypothetical protein